MRGLLALVLQYLIEVKVMINKSMEIIKYFKMFLLCILMCSLSIAAQAQNKTIQNNKCSEGTTRSGACLSPRLANYAKANRKIMVARTQSKISKSSSLLSAGSFELLQELSADDTHDTHDSFSEMRGVDSYKSRVNIPTALPPDLNPQLHHHH
jgi:hypothetical protein